MTTSPTSDEPGRDCPLCPRLAAFRETQRACQAGWHNAPVPSFGPPNARLLIVGLAPGVRGANRTGRPFTGDHAGILLYQTLLAEGFATGHYGADPADGLCLLDCRITNAVRCVPPGNLPKPTEVAACNRFLAAELSALTELRAVLALGTLAHTAVLRALGLKLSHCRFKHGALHDMPDGLVLANSYHVSRLNTSTKRLTEDMFRAVVRDIRSRIAPALAA